MPRPVSRADLARLLGVSRPAITKRCARDLAPACDGDRVDLDHPAVKAAAMARGIKIPKAPPPAPPRPIAVAAATDDAPTAKPKLGALRLVVPTAAAAPELSEPAKPTGRRREREPLPQQPDNAGTPEDITELGLLLRPLVARFGTERGFRDWLLSLKDIETITGKQLENARTQGFLIPRDFVKTHVFGAIEGTNRRLLSDTPKTLCRELYALAKSGAPLEDAERMARKLLGKQLETVKSRVVRALRNAGSDNGSSELARGAVRSSDDRDGPDDAERVGGI